jgi:uncharacterized membrane protein
VLWFRRDPIVKHAIGSFLATFLYSLVALRDVRPDRDDTSPDVTVAIALLLLGAATILFLVLLEQVMNRLRPRTLYGAVAREGIRAAVGAGATLEMVPGVGEYVVPGQALLRVHGTVDATDETLLRAVDVADERTIRQDPAFALRIIVDTAIRALSPAVNDPTTEGSPEHAAAQRADRLGLGVSR